MKSHKIKIETSSRHVHLSREHCNRLFGKGYELTPMKDLSQPTEFAAGETLTLENGKEAIEGVRIIGPLRKQTQVEISRTDAYELGIDPPLRSSGNIKGSARVTLVGPKGKLKIREGTIIAKRHIHASVQEADKLGLKNNQVVDVEIDGARSLIFKNVKVRVGEKYSLSMHIDTDEANAAGIDGVGKGEILKG